MPAVTSLAALATRLQELLEQRQQHADAMAQIDQTLEQVRAVLGGVQPRRGRPPKSVLASMPTAEAPVKHRRRRRGRFGTSAEESILAFVKANKNPTTQEIKGLWKQEGRGGSADNVLSMMVKKKKLKRQPLVGQRGSRYMLA